MKLFCAPSLDAAWESGFVTTKPWYVVMYPAVFTPFGSNLICLRWPSLYPFSVVFCVMTLALVISSASTLTSPGALHRRMTRSVMVP